MQAPPHPPKRPPPRLPLARVPREEEEAGDVQGKKVKKGGRDIWGEMGEREKTRPPLELNSEIWGEWVCNIWEMGGLGEN